MKKTVLFCCALLALVNLAKAQTPATVIKHSHDFLVIGVSHDSWVGAGDSLKLGGLSRGLNIALMYDFPVKEGSHLSVAPGLGISSSSIFLKKQTLGIGQGTTSFNIRSDSSYKHYKLATTYVEIPVMLRYRSYPDNANKGFKAALGLKFGALLNAHTKGKKLAEGSKQVDKVTNKQYFQPWRVVGSARVGWGNLSLFANYSLTYLLKTGAGPTINPLQIGVSLSGL